MSENIWFSRMFQQQADAMIFVKNRLGKFYERNIWETISNVLEIATYVWETSFSGKIVSVPQTIFTFKR